METQSPDPASPAAPPALERAVPRWQVLALAVNSVVGSGIYLLPAAAAATLGAASVGAVPLAGLVVFLVVACFAEAGSRFDQPGSAYLYTREAFGEFPGFTVGWMAWLTRVASVASLTVGLADAVTFLLPSAGAGSVRTAMIVGPLVLLTVINVVGVRAGAGAAALLAIAKLVPLALFVAVGLFVASPATALAQEPTRAGGLGATALLLLYAYAGFENTAAPAGEYRDPRRDVPFALFAHLALVVVLYTAVQWVALGVLPGLAASTTPLADAAAVFLGPWGLALLGVGGVVSILGTASDSVLSGPRYLLALARDGYGPRGVAAIHPRFHTPAMAIVVQAAIALPLALTGSFVGLAALSVVARLITYVGTAAAVPVLRRRQGRAPLTLPGGPTIPLAAIAVALALATSAERSNLVAAGVALLVGAGVFALRRRDTKPSRGRAL
ncbi:MAG: APC family permease [Acidobacteriota bacterium]